MASTLRIQWQVVRQVVRVGHFGKRVHAVAMIYGPENGLCGLCKQFAQMLLVAPRHEPRVVMQCALRDAPLRAHAAVGFVQANGCQANAGQQQ